MTVSGGLAAIPSSGPRGGQQVSFSVVICTDGRAAALATTLRSLLYLDRPAFEVIIVRGPTEDGIVSVLAEWEGRIKVAQNPARNLSVSRNLGIAAAAGDVVAFLDDDAVPEPEWLAELAVAYDDPAVGCAGGFVFNPDGVTFQYRYGTVDRLGRADLSWQRAAPELAFPFTANIPHPLGANSSFRRRALLAIGGFDEEFEYYLDETDVTARLVDAGWRVAQIGGAHVHHKFLPSQIRNEARVVTAWYPVLKNHIYFGLVNGLAHHSLDTVIGEARAFIERFSRDVDWAVGAGKLTEADRTRFWQDVDRAWRDGLSCGLAGVRKLPARDRWSAKPPPFLRFPILQTAGGRRCFCFLSQEYPPGPVGGIGRYLHQMARTIAALGHHVHVLTRGDGHHRVDFEDGTWVHRLPPREAPGPPPAGVEIPPHIWAHSHAMLEELRRVAAGRSIDAVYAPIWDCEGAAVLLDGTFPLVTGLQTTLHFWMESHPHVAADPAFQRDFASPMLALERRVLRDSDGVHAISQAILRDIAWAYDTEFDGARTAVVPLGLEDWTALPRQDPEALPSGTLRLLFVGRLEPRKGIDVLLAAAKRVLARHPNVYLDLVGNDRIPASDGRTQGEVFAADRAADDIRDRVRFWGAVSEERLRGFYSACDVLVTPSRFESFGLMLVEGMMFGKPVVGCRAGGMAEVVEDGVSGLLAEADNVDSLAAHIERLVVDDDLRIRLGASARARYEERFNPARMADGVVAFLSSLTMRRDCALAHAAAT